MFTGKNGIPLFHRLLGRRKNAIILGAGAAEYALYLQLEEEKCHTVLFFIDEDPWAHRSRLGNAELRYPAELAQLCSNYEIDAVFYCSPERARDLPKLKCKVVGVNA